MTVCAATHTGPSGEVTTCSSHDGPWHVGATGTTWPRTPVRPFPLPRREPSAPRWAAAAVSVGALVGIIAGWLSYEGDEGV